MGKLINTLAVALTCFVIALSADLFRIAGLSLYTEQVLAGLLALALPLVFLHVPAGGGRGGRSGTVPWYDLCAAVVSFAIASYIAVRYPALSDLASRRPWDGLLAAGAIIALFLEGLRRTTGMPLVITTAAFFVLALVGGSLPGELAARSIPLDRRLVLPDRYDEYVLVGWSFGGILAYELARLLAADDVTVSRLVLIDAYLQPLQGPVLTPRARAAHAFGGNGSSLDAIDDLTVLEALLGEGATLPAKDTAPYEAIIRTYRTNIGALI